MPRRKKCCDPSSSSSSSRTNNHGGIGRIKEKPQQRNAANARERARMRVLSRAFFRLKTALSWVPPDTKLSKLDTLRMASKHIAGLKAALDSDNPLSNPCDYFYPQVTMTWPYGLSKGPGGSGVMSVLEPTNSGDEDEEDEDGDEESLSCVSASSSSWDEARIQVTSVTSMNPERNQMLAHSKLTMDNHHYNSIGHNTFEQLF